MLKLEKELIEAFHSEKLYGEGKLEGGTMFTEKQVETVKEIAKKAAPKGEAPRTPIKIDLADNIAASFLLFFINRVATLAQIAALFSLDDEEKALFDGVVKTMNLFERFGKSKKLTSLDNLLRVTFATPLGPTDINVIRVIAETHKKDTAQLALVVECLKVLIFKQFLCDPALATAFHIPEKLFVGYQPIRSSVVASAMHGFVKNMFTEAKGTSADCALFMREIVTTPLLGLFFIKNRLSTKRGSLDDLTFIYFMMVMREFQLQRHEFVIGNATNVELCYVPTLKLSTNMVINISDTWDVCALMNPKEFVTKSSLIHWIEPETMPKLADYYHQVRSYKIEKNVVIERVVAEIKAPHPTADEGKIEAVQEELEKAEVKEEKIEEKIAELKVAEPAEGSADAARVAKLEKELEEVRAAVESKTQQLQSLIAKKKSCSLKELRPAVEAYASACNIAVRFCPYLLDKRMIPLAVAPGVDSVKVGGGVSSDFGAHSMYEKLDAMECKADGVMKYRIPEEVLRDMAEAEERGDESLEADSLQEATAIVEEKMTEAIAFVSKTVLRWLIFVTATGAEPETVEEKIVDTLTRSLGFVPETSEYDTSAQDIAKLAEDPIKRELFVSALEARLFLQ